MEEALVRLYSILIEISAIVDSARSIFNPLCPPLLQVNEYLKEILTQEQKREAASAEPAGSPRVCGVLSLLS